VEGEDGQREGDDGDWKGDGDRKGMTGIERGAVTGRG